MIDLTLLDIVILTLLGPLIVVLGGIALKYLSRGDRERNRGNQCPPHEWNRYYMDTPTGGYQFVGLRCSKCKRTPGGLPNGESWADKFGGSGGLPLP